MANPSNPAVLMGKPYNPEGPTELQYFNGQRPVMLPGGLEKAGPGLWREPGRQDGPLFNGRGVHVIDDRGAIYRPPLVMAVNYKAPDRAKPAPSEWED